MDLSPGQGSEETADFLGHFLVCIHRLADLVPQQLALGPEGGFIPYEVESFRQRGFTPVSLGDRILSVEVALTAALGVLARA